MEPKDLSGLSPAGVVEAVLRACGGILVNTLRAADAAHRLRKDEDDILADFCLHLLEKQAAPLYLWRGECKITTWTALIFRRWLRDRLRSVPKQTDASDIIDYLPAPGDDLPDQIQKNDVSEKLELCIQALPELPRQLIREKMYHEANLQTLGKKYKLGKRIYPFIRNIFEQLKDCLEKKKIQFNDL